MKLPRNMKEEEVIKQIMTIVDRIAPKYAFNGYSVEDIKQESFIICMDALDRYDPNRPLENFLSVHLSNRLKNFVRDNYFTKNDDETKKKLLNAKSIISEDVSVEETDYIEQVDLGDIKTIIDCDLPMSYRSDYLKIINNVYVPKKRRAEVMSILKQIVESASAKRKN
jgi:DNA-directed RNA polymerase specialized sigma24 family protein